MSRAGRLLLAEGLVSQSQLEEAARHQSLEGGTIGLHLVRAGVVREGALVSTLSSALGLQEATTEELESVGDEVAALVPSDVSIISRVVPLELLGDDWLCVAMADPTDDKTVAEVARQTARRLLIKVAPESEISLTLERLHGTSRPRDLPEWNSKVESSPLQLEQGPTTEVDIDIDVEEEPVTSSRRFKAPIVLEGRYDKISPDELPDDADAGYIPLTQVKRRPPGSKPGAQVIEVKNIDISEVERAEGAREQGTAPEQYGEQKERLLPLHEEILETLSSVVSRPPDDEGTVARTSVPSPALPASPLDELEHEMAESASKAASNTPSRPAPSQDSSDPEDGMVQRRKLSTVAPPPGSWPPDEGLSSTPPLFSTPPPRPTSTKPPPYAGVPGGESWLSDDDDDNEERHTAFDLESREERDSSTVRDTLIDLPKIDPSHFSKQAEMTLEELRSTIEGANSRDEAVQTALSFIASYCRRSAFFVLKRGVIEGFDALGPNLTLEQVRSIWIPLSSRSTLCEAVASRSIRIGPIGDSRTDAIFSAALGGRRGDSLIVPVVLGTRVVSVLYGDDLRGSSPSLDQLETLSKALSDALTRMLMRDKHQK